MKKYLFFAYIFIQFLAVGNTQLRDCYGDRDMKICYFVTSTPHMGISNISVVVRFSTGEERKCENTNPEGKTCLPIMGRNREKQGDVKLFYPSGEIITSIPIADLRQTDRYILTNIIPDKLQTVPLEKDRRINSLKQTVKRLEDKINFLQEDSQSNKNFLDESIAKLRTYKDELKSMEESVIGYTEQITRIEDELKRTEAIIIKKEEEIQNAITAWCLEVQKGFPIISEFKCVPTNENRIRRISQKARSIYDWEYIELSFNSSKVSNNRDDKKLFEYHIEGHIEYIQGNSMKREKFLHHVVDMEQRYTSGITPIKISNESFSNLNYQAVYFDLYFTAYYPFNTNRAVKVVGRVANGSYRITNKYFDFPSWMKDLTHSFLLGCSSY